VNNSGRRTLHRPSHPLPGIHRSPPPTHTPNPVWPDADAVPAIFRTCSL